MHRPDQTPPCDPSISNSYNQIAAQLVDSFDGFTSIDDLRRHLKLMLKAMQNKPNQLAAKEIN
jgi:hypothetical protein